MHQRHKKTAQAQGYQTTFRTTFSLARSTFLGFHTRIGPASFQYKKLRTDWRPVAIWIRFCRDDGRREHTEDASISMASPKGPYDRQTESLRKYYSSRHGPFHNFSQCTRLRLPIIGSFWRIPGVRRLQPC